MEEEVRRPKDDAVTEEDAAARELFLLLLLLTPDESSPSPDPTRSELERVELFRVDKGDERAVSEMKKKEDKE